MRWLLHILTIFAMLIYLVLPVGLAIAGSSIDVTVTATPMVSIGILNFTIIYVSDTRLDFTWDYAPGYDRIMIRGKYSEYPHNIPDIHTTPTDGYLAYYGNGVNASDTSMDFSQNPGPLYISAWGQRVTNEWSVHSSIGQEESIEMLFLGFIGLAVAVTVVCFLWHNIIFALAGMIAWVVLGVWTLTGGSPSIDPSTPWGSMLGYLFVLLAFSPLVRYISRVGKVQVQQSKNGKMFSLWEPPPKPETLTRAQQTRAKHKSRLQAIRDRRNINR